jgi:hypothetical protein
MRWLLVLALAAACSALVPAADPSSATFMIDGRPITLVAGRAEQPAAPGSAAKIVTSLGTQRADADIDGDGRLDRAVALVHQPGGSGTFTYVALLLNPTTGPSGTNAVLIGDRITLSALRVDGRVIVVEYLERRPGEPFTTAPSVATTKRLSMSGGKLSAQ